ncbi:hypothetical protein E2C01_020032 [Portunus trituberculatus]|uniref:Uncharacterized protein n=1 Tax=Portunus trituberculatus TaxID=210409 RepID=A0A5B7DYT4_PORTR|nr:hypothetical protein [Portunus trituberculatus]
MKGCVRYTADRCEEISGRWVGGCGIQALTLLPHPPARPPPPLSPPPVPPPTVLPGDLFPQILTLIVVGGNPRHCSSHLQRVESSGAQVSFLSLNDARGNECSAVLCGCSQQTNRQNN